MDVSGPVILLLILSLLTCGVMIAAAVCKPRIQIGKLPLDTYWIVAVIGALIILAAGFISPASLAAGLTADTAVNPLKILVLFLSMTFISVFLDELGFFRYLAVQTVRWSGASQIRLFIAFYLVISLLTVFTSNDVIILTFTPFICYFAKYAGISPVPYLIGEFVAANTWSMTLLIGNPTNIYLASSFGIGFMDYLSVMALPAAAGSLVAFGMVFLVFHRQFRKPVSAVPDRFAIQDKPAVAIGITVLAVCVVLLAVSSSFGIEMWAVSLGCAIVLAVICLIRSACRKEIPAAMGHAALRVPWQFIPFILAMFTIVLAVSQAGVTEWIAGLLSADSPAFTYGISSFLAANIINNIPMSVLYAGVLSGASAASLIPGLYAAVIGSNLGALLTPIGALAGLMWISILKKNQVVLTAGRFIGYGIIISIPALLASLAVLTAVLGC